MIGLTDGRPVPYLYVTGDGVGEERGFACRR